MKSIAEIDVVANVDAVNRHVEASMRRSRSGHVTENWALSSSAEISEAIVNCGRAPSLYDEESTDEQHSDARSPSAQGDRDGYGRCEGSSCN